MQARVKKQYLELIDQFPLLPITSDKEHDAAVKVMLGLSKRDGQLNATEIGYGQVLGSLIADYETKKLGDYFTKERSTGPEILAYLLEENQMMQVEAAKIAGSLRRRSIVLWQVVEICQDKPASGLQIDLN